MMKDIALVIPCYNRTESLQRLLDSLLKAKYDRSVELVFSIDFSGHRDVEDLAECFVWPYGRKTIIKHTYNVGLRNNIISCGDLTNKYDAVIVLEDDLIVSPFFFDYASKACDFYWDDDRIAGISLYSYHYSEDRRVFSPITDGFDTYFMQWTSSWGQLWTRRQWSAFRSWYNKQDEDLSEYNIPAYVMNWDRSWKKFNIAYLSDCNKFYVYPTQSFSTVTSALGTHVKNSNPRNPFVVPLCTGIARDFTFRQFNCSVMYDSFFEPTDQLLDVEGKKSLVSFDIYRTKESRDLNGDYFVTSQLYSKVEPIMTWGRELIPFERNVFEQIVGEGLYMYKVCDYQNQRLTLQEKRDMGVDMPLRDMVLLFCEKMLKKVHLKK